MNKLFFDDINDVDVNYVYMNLEGNKKQKLKVVHFAENNIANENKGSNIINKSNLRKSNLKKGNIKKEFNRTLTFNQNNLLENRNKR